MYSPIAVDRRVDVMASMARVVNRRRYILDAEVAGFEEAFAAFCRVAHSIGVANGTDALELPLRALEVGPGDRVAMTSNAGPYASAAARAVGAMPQYVEIDPATRTMSANALAAAAATGPAAVIVTHLYGQLADMD